MEDQESRRLSKALAQQARGGAGAGQIADTVVAVWRRVDAALLPIVGQRGVAALYKRSLHLANAAHPWLGAPQDGVPAQRLGTAGGDRLVAAGPSGQAFSIDLAAASHAWRDALPNALGADVPQSS